MVHGHFSSQAVVAIEASATLEVPQELAERREEAAIGSEEELPEVGRFARMGRFLTRPPTNRTHAVCAKSPMRSRKRRKQYTASLRILIRPPRPSLGYMKSSRCAAHRLELPERHDRDRASHVCEQAVPISFVVAQT